MASQPLLTALSIPLGSSSCPSLVKPPPKRTNPKLQNHLTNQTNKTNKHEYNTSKPIDVDFFSRRNYIARLLYHHTKPGFNALREDPRLRLRGVVDGAVSLFGPVALIQQVGLRKGLPFLWVYRRLEVTKIEIFYCRRCNILDHVDNKIDLFVHHHHLNGKQTAPKPKNQLIIFMHGKLYAFR